METKPESVSIDMDTECAAFTNKMQTAVAEAKIPMVVIVGLIEVIKSDMIGYMQVQYKEQLKEQMDQGEVHGRH